MGPFPPSLSLSPRPTLHKGGTGIHKGVDVFVFGVFMKKRFVLKKSVDASPLVAYIYVYIYELTLCGSPFRYGMGFFTFASIGIIAACLR
jgi:hypothetical protein